METKYIFELLPLSICYDIGWLIKPGFQPSISLAQEGNIDW